VIMIRTENRRSTSQAASCAALMRRLGDSQWDAPGFPFPQIAPGDQERRGVESLVLVGYGPVERLPMLSLILGSMWEQPTAPPTLQVGQPRKPGCLGDLFASL